MDALKKFLTKKKADKKFNQAGPGYRLTDSNNASGSPRGQGAPRMVASPGQVQHRHPGEPSAERKAAAAAALARIEKTKSSTNPKEMLAHRQMNFIKEQARKELEAEQKLKELEAKGLSGSPVKASEPPPFEYTMDAEKGKPVDPAHYVVQGVYFTCSLIGPEVASYAEINNSIREFLLAQPEEELGMTSCLLIYSCNKGRERVQNCVDTLCKYLDNIIQNPTELKYQKIRVSNKVFQEKVASILGATQFLEASGFKLTNMKPDEASPAEDFWVFNLGEETMEDAVGSLTELRDTLKNTTPIRPELDRNVQVLMPAQVTKRRELPPEFYELSGEELKREQRLRSEIVERELTLRTKAQREKDEMREQRLYRYVVMRIRFPDGLTLQGTFYATEKLGDLYAFVQENLGFDDGEFSLRTARGEILSDLEATLAQAHLPPASIVNFKLESGGPSSTTTTGEIGYLRPEIMALVQEMA